MTETFLELEETWLFASGVVQIDAFGCDRDSQDLALQIEGFLGRDSRLDPDRCSRSSKRCRISLCCAGKDVWSGAIVRSDGEWLIHREAGDDDPAWRLHARTVRPGEYLVVLQPDRTLSFRIASVRVPQSALAQPA